MSSRKVACLLAWWSGSAAVNVAPLPEVGEPRVPQISNEVTPLVLVWFWSVELIV